ncbi:MAG: type I-U CRISPR-associated RAMP protein Csb1/Cas7u [bacterium]|nr:type I-U CRISPR-associated RAMP protein Csb1/Cas7u [bacterium]MDE0287915.1 type I-U CRISPR-associated RAMP protein Csb1/Cas7u [bacterium]MDE0439706.1 type I-U CRISPR-associated RAMP protein Csb1/Cas7u [bacterium]
MAELTFERLRDAVAGDAVALRSRTTLQPAGGQGDKVFPPTYAVAQNAEHRYAVEERHHDGKVSTSVLLDSVASQANRAELALLEGWESGELKFPVPLVDFGQEREIGDIGRLTVLEAPHRLADAIFRDSLLGGTLFRLSDAGRAITDAQPRNATALFQYSPTALVFGMWDSTGPKGGLGSKFQRAYVSEIVGLDAQIGKKVGSRLDPLQIEREAVARQIFIHKDPDQVWTLEHSEAARKKGKPEIKGDGRPAEINHGNIAPSIDTDAGGVTISQAVQTTVLSLAALRRLRFSGHSRAAEIAARTAVAALGVASIAYQHEMDYDLRSRCLLIPEHPPRVELVGRDGSPAEVVTIDRHAARNILDRASSHASDEGIGWQTDEMVMVPAPKLVELIKRSRALSTTQQPSD